MVLVYLTKFNIDRYDWPQNWTRLTTDSHPTSLTVYIVFLLWVSNVLTLDILLVIARGSTVKWSLMKFNEAQWFTEERFSHLMLVGSTVGKGGSRHKNWCMAKVLGFLIRHFSNYYTLHHSDLAARAAPLDPRLVGVL